MSYPILRFFPSWALPANVYAIILSSHFNLLLYKALNVWDFIQIVHKPLYNPLKRELARTSGASLAIGALSVNERLFFCDTNILRYLVDNPPRWLALRKHLSEINALLVLSWIKIVELSKVPHYHEGISRILLNTPSALLKWWKDLLGDEVKCYPDTFTIDPIQPPLISDYLQGRLGQFILQV